MAKAPATAPADMNPSIWREIAKTDTETTSVMEVHEGVVLRVDTDKGTALLFIPGVMVHRDGNKLARAV